MKRIFLFLATNLAIVFVLSITLHLLGVDRILDQQGVGLDVNNLLILSAVIGFGGSLFSLNLQMEREAHDGRARHRAARQRRGKLAG